MAAKCFAVGVTIAFCALAFGSGQPKGERDAFSLYSKSLEKSCRYHVSAVINQRDPQNGGWELVKVDRDKDGHVHKAVLQPLRMQGIESVDDGERWQTLLPDDHVILDQESSLRHSDFAVQRLKLAKKNYRFSFEPDSVVAGRKTYCILARPVHEEIFARRYFLDEQTLYPLRSETIRGEDTQVEFVTKDVEYPSRMDPDTFVLHNTAGYKWIKMNSPVKAPSASEARRELGFNLVLPKHLPFGFETQEMQLSTTGKWRALVVRLTDGLARATVYEYAASESGISAMEHSSTLQVGEVMLQIVSDIDEGCRKEILETFEEQLEQLSRAGQWGLVLP